MRWLLDPEDTIGAWPRVLLVEDDHANRRRIRNILADEGIVVVAEASDGAAGSQLARELEPDVVLMDLRMPSMGGLEATRVIKETVPLTQVIILTSYEGRLPERSAEQAGAFAYLVKGCPAEMLRELIHHAWRHKLGLERAQRLGEAEGAGGFASDLFGESGAGAASASWSLPRSPGSGDPPAEWTAPLEDAESLEALQALPDSVPEDFVERFGREARHVVRYRSSRRYRLTRLARSRFGELRDREVWTMAIIVFGLSVFAFAFAGALAYMIVLWPWTGLFIVAPLVVLLPFSLWMATRIVRKERGGTEDPNGKYPSAW